MDSLPFVTADLPGIRGRIKATPSHFMVEEIPLYPPLGRGEHVYLCLAREGWTTRALQKQLAHLFSLRLEEVGYAGLKDRHASVVQTFSLCLPHLAEEVVAERIEKHLPVKVLSVYRHPHKLRVGHLRGNRFRIVLQSTSPEAVQRAEAIAQAIQTCGVPNYFGRQRFGRKGDNAQRGEKLFTTPRLSGLSWKKRLLLSAYQAALFNTWLAERIRRGWFLTLLTGDIAKKWDTGGLFEVEDGQKEWPRFQQKEITYTGPIYGFRMRWARGEARLLEEEVWKKGGITEVQLRQARLRGSRRPAQCFPQELSITPHPEGLLLTFTLRKGAYATTVLREFCKEALQVGDPRSPEALS